MTFKEKREQAQNCEALNKESDLKFKHGLNLELKSGIKKLRRQKKSNEISEALEWT